MAWVTVETNGGEMVTRFNTAIYYLESISGFVCLTEIVLRAVDAAHRIEEPLESLEDDS